MSALTSAPSTESDAWRVLHVVMDGDPDRVERLLLATVGPWTARALDTGVLGAWYFIRPPRDPATGEALVKLRFRDVEDRDLAVLRGRIDAFLRRDAGAARPGSVAERPFRPEDSRFGGPEAMAAALRRFPDATGVALATMRSTRPGPERLDAAADLLLASVWAMAGRDDPAAAAAWLRAYAAAQAGPGAVPPADLERARAESESCHRRDESVRQRRLDTVRAAADSGDGRIGQWYRLMADTWTALADLHARGRMSAPPGSVFGTLVQMAHNRLGLRPQDNAYLASLIAFVPDR